MKVEIGGGLTPREGYLSCDIRKLPKVDYVCNADNLPFNNDELEEVYSRHLIEHLTLKEFLKTLEEWNRVLKVGGVLYIICPNILWHLEQILNGNHDSFYSKKSGENHRYWGFGSLFGWQQNSVDIHKFGYYPELLIDILKEFGFCDIEDLTNTGKGIENQPWHLEIKAKKEKKSPKFFKSKLYSHFNVNH